MKRGIALVLAAAACAPSAQAPPMPAVPISVASLQADSIAQILVRRATEADARIETPDSVYLEDAEIIANGAPRADAPRLAGVDSGGTIELGSSRFAVTGSYVWGTTEYRWMPGNPARRIVEGWATFIIVRTRDGAWRIAHVHSSTVRDTPTPGAPSGG